MQVLDYQLVQSLSPTPYTNLLALFSGIVHWNMTGQKTMLDPLPIQELFGRYAVEEYRTVWMDGHCWKTDRGLARYLGIHR